MECESYNLNWAEFTSYTSKTFKDLLHNQDFADVTLVCDDDEAIKAHKVILSACSPFFNRILKKNNEHNHPLIYLSDVNLNELKAVINFMYLGQTNVEQENLQRFLKIAAKFQVQGLTENNRKEENIVDPKPAITSNKSSKKVPSPSKYRQDACVKTSDLLINDNSYADETNMNQLLLANPDVKLEGDAMIGDIDDTDVDNIDNLDSIDTSQFAIENMMTMTPTVSVDNNKEFPCDQCDYKATYACNLTSHKRTVHQGLYYSCSLCEYKSSRKDRLNKHYLNKHNYQNTTA